MNTKAYNGVRYFSKNGYYYTENCIVVIVQWLKYNMHSHK
jgi:hypothetical protein